MEINLKEAMANIANYLEACIHQAFTIEADNMLKRGALTREQRILLSSFIGSALDTFSTRLDTEAPDLRSKNTWGEDMGLLAATRESFASEPAPEETSAPAVVVGVRESRQIAERLRRTMAEAVIDGQGNMSGVIVVEGESLNGNIYTRQALESGIETFADQPIYADHPSRIDEQTRPERSVRDLVGRLPGREGLTVEALTTGLHAGKYALCYRGARLSETATWLKTLIQEGIAGDMSINATGEGREEGKRFVVEAFVTRPGQITSLDFVTTAAAGGAATLVESAKPTEPEPEVKPEPTLQPTEPVNQPVTEAEPALAQQAASGNLPNGKLSTKPTKEVSGMKFRNLREAEQRVAALETALQKEQREKRQTQANQIVSEALTGSGLPAKAQARVKQMVEATVKQFIEQIELPTVQLPADVEALPDEVKAVWSKSFFASAPDGEEQAAYKAWSDVFTAFDHEENGNWKAKSGTPAEGEPPAEGGVPEGEMPTEDETATGEADAVPGEMDKEKPEEEACADDEKKPMMSAAALQAAVRQAVQSERSYLAEVSGAGKVKGMGAAPAAPQTKTTEVDLEEAFSALLPEKEAKIAATGR